MTDSASEVKSRPLAVLQTSATKNFVGVIVFVVAATVIILFLCYFTIHRSTARVCGRSVAGILGSTRARGMDVCLS